jgi:hypothetical protein
MAIAIKSTLKKKLLRLTSVLKGGTRGHLRATNVASSETLEGTAA